MFTQLTASCRFGSALRTLALAVLLSGAIAPAALADHMGNHIRGSGDSQSTDTTAVACGSETVDSSSDSQAMHFVAYPAVSASAFENYGFKEALTRAASLAERRVVVDSADNQPYISALFYGALMAPEARVPIVIGDRSRLAPGDVLVFADPRFAHRDMREGLPAQSYYAIARYDAARNLGTPY